MCVRVCVCMCVCVCPCVCVCVSACVCVCVGGGGCLGGGVGVETETQCRSVCADSFATKSERFFSHTITISNDQTLILDIIGRRRRIVHRYF